MEQRSPSPGSTILVVAAVVIVFAGMKAAADIVVPFLLSIFLATLTGPIVFWLHRHRIPKLVAILLVLAAVVGGLALIGTVTLGTVREFNRNLQTYQQGLESQIEPMLQWLRDMLDRLGLASASQGFEPDWDLGAVLGVAGSTLLQFGNVLTKVFLAVMTVLFMLLEAFHLPAKVTRALGPAERTRASFEAFASSVQKYLAIKTATSLLTGVCAGVLVWAVGIDYPIFWGLLAFLFNYIPNIGSIIAATPAVLMALVQHGIGAALIVLIGYLLINFAIGGALEPHFMGDGVGLSPLVVLMSLVFWGWLLGGVGMLLSTPLTMSVKIALDNFPETRWISTVISSGKA